MPFSMGGGEKCLLLRLCHLWVPLQWLFVHLLQVPLFCGKLCHLSCLMSLWGHTSAR